MKKEIRLKQHTPIIHFQHNQAGATLRASELKPKIDRFVLKELKHVDPELFKDHEKLVECNFSEKKVPSKYKVLIKAGQPGGKPIKYATFISRRDREALSHNGLVLKYPAPYFGDHLALRHDDVRVEIFSFDDKLAEFLKKVLPYVLSYNNFGSRQSKGFGCFLPESIDKKEFEKILCRKDKLFWVTSAGNNDPFKVIQDTYQLLKGGTNHPYRKSELFEYMCGRGVKWEKHKIKNELKSSASDIFNILKYDKTVKSNRINGCPATDEKMEHRYIRAMLGLAEHNEYMVDSVDTKKIQIVIKDNDGVKDKEGPIERFRSPITFKVMNGYIYLLPETICNRMINREFSFTLQIKKRAGGNPPSKLLFNLKTPDTFDLRDFLEKHLPKVNKVKKYDWQRKGK